MKLTPEILRGLIIYNPETGCLTWKERGDELFKAPRFRKLWNTKWAGKLALNHSTNSGCYGGTVLAIPLLAHRVAWAIHYGKWPDKFIDHINGDRFDNRISNLRDVDRVTNNKNAKRRKDNKSGYSGVYKHKNRYLAHIRVDGRLKVIGRFDTAEEAHAFREVEKLKYGFHPNHGRDE